MVFVANPLKTLTIVFPLYDAASWFLKTISLWLFFFTYTKFPFSLVCFTRPAWRCHFTVSAYGLPCDVWGKDEGMEAQCGRWVPWYHRAKTPGSWGSCCTSYHCLESQVGSSGIHWSSCPPSRLKVKIPNANFVFLKGTGSSLCSWLLIQSAAKKILFPESLHSEKGGWPCHFFFFWSSHKECCM